MMMRINLPPEDLLLAAIVRQAIADLRYGPKAERQAARDYLAQLGLLDDAGAVVAPCEADMELLWPPMDQAATEGRTSEP